MYTFTRDVLPGWQVTNRNVLEAVVDRERRGEVGTFVAFLGYFQELHDDVYLSLNILIKNFKTTLM